MTNRFYSHTYIQCFSLVQRGTLVFINHTYTKVNKEQALCFIKKHYFHTKQSANIICFTSSFNLPFTLPGYTPFTASHNYKQLEHLLTWIPKSSISNTTTRVLEPATNTLMDFVLTSSWSRWLFDLLHLVHAGVGRLVLSAGRAESVQADVHIGVRPCAGNGLLKQCMVKLSCSSLQWSKTTEEKCCVINLVQEFHRQILTKNEYLYFQTAKISKFKFCVWLEFKMFSAFGDKIKKNVHSSCTP